MKTKKMTLKQLADFFGDRGKEFKRRYVKKIGNDENYIYWIPNNKYKSFFETTEYHWEKEETVMWVYRKSMYLEVEDEVLLKDSPYNFETGETKV